jgi:hypothetical protein
MRLTYEKYVIQVVVPPAGGGGSIEFMSGD